MVESKRRKSPIPKDKIGSTLMSWTLFQSVGYGKTKQSKAKTTAASKPYLLLLVYCVAICYWKYS